jgi:hypothetical protein
MSSVPAAALPSPAAAEAAVSAPRRLRPSTLALLGASGLTAAGGGLLGFLSHSTQAAIEGRQTGCPGTGDLYFQCFAGRVQAGRAEAQAANVLFVAAGTLALAATLLFWWPPGKEPPEAER